MARGRIQLQLQIFAWLQVGARLMLAGIFRKGER